MPKPELRPYQLDVIRRIHEHFAKGQKRGILQGATGSGKTNCSSEICLRATAKNKRVLFLAHRRRLIHQKSERLNEFGVCHGIVMAGEWNWHDAPVQVASRDTLLSRAVRNEWIKPPPADLVIVDEAHGCMSEEYQQLLQMYPDAYVVGMTATPARADGKGLAPYFDFIECMVPTSQLIAEGWLVPVSCYAPSRKGFRSGGSELRGSPVDNWLRYAKGRATILFTPKVKHSRDAANAFTAAGVKAEHIDAHTPDDARERIIERVKSGETKIICNCSVFTEGVDVPELSCCVLLRRCGSYVLYAQAVGRIMRRHPGKVGAILIDHAGAVWKHGFPDEDVDWQLTEGETVDQRVKRDKDAGKRRKPICCPVCAAVFSGSVVCPACGYKMPLKHLPVKTRAELLVLAHKGMTPERATATKHSYWVGCLKAMAYKGRCAGAAAHMFKSRYGEWPGRDFPMLPPFGRWKEPVTVLFPNLLSYTGTGP